MKTAALQPLNMLLTYHTSAVALTHDPSVHPFLGLAFIRSFVVSFIHSFLALSGRNRKKHSQQQQHTILLTISIHLLPGSIQSVVER
jgi:hypothetical protein